MIKKLIFIFFCISISITAQSERSILYGVISDDFSVLPNVHVVNTTDKKVTFSLDNGSFEIFAKVNDSLKVSCIGYKTKFIQVAPHHFGIETKNIKLEKDTPIDFGYKSGWIAVKTDDRQRIAEILKLKNIEPSNWEQGIQSSYAKGIFITPNIGSWTLVVGMSLADNVGTIDGVSVHEKKINELSAEFGEAQSFVTYRVDEYHHWMKSIDGKAVRIYSFGSGENYKVFGTLTEPEKKLNLFNSLSEEAKQEQYWEREDLDYPDEELVMKIAKSWSVDPTELSERNDIINELGLIGEL